ncbi:MAG: gliding motility-associated C-terminal domain-containing protein [Spirochaetales bacterium]|nr:gliding motility-associated C-terminal domain-containing protein [Spirochaetales bacterium]
MTMNKRINLIIVLLVVFFAGGEVFAQAIAGSDIVPDFYSPFLQAGGPSVVSTISPASDLMNPAASAAKQRFTIDLSYLGLFGPGTPVWQGHGVNLGATHPTKIGVFSWSGHFLSSEALIFPAGTQGGIRGSFAKDVYENLYVGMGLNLGFGTGGWSITSNWGFLHFPGDISFMKNFVWGITLQEFGYAPMATTSAVHPLFTLAAGTGFTLINAEKFQLNAQADLSFPTFQNMRLSVGLTSKLFNALSLHLSSDVDIKELIAGDTSGLIPSFGISYTFQTNIQQDSKFLRLKERGWNESQITPVVSAAPYAEGYWGIGTGVNIPLGVLDRDPPEILVTCEDPTYISPNFDGTQDELSLPIEITDRRYIKGYSLTIYNNDGEAVRTIYNKEQREENVEIGFFKRLFQAKSGIDIPETLVWNGNSDEGNVVPDGSYTFVLESWDDNGNNGKTGKQTVVVDATAPEIVITAPDSLIFSPNADGNKDDITIGQSGSSEDLWEARIVDPSGNTLRTITLVNDTPKDFVWDGTDADGLLIGDGVYNYIISSTDRSGNSTEESLDNIIINTEATPITLTIDKAFFSPNGDDVKDSVMISPNIPVQSGIDFWEVVIKNISGKSVRSYSGGKLAPGDITFDGKGVSGNLLPEGGYTATLKVRYLNGNAPEETSPPFTIDVTPPTASVRADLRVFSPNGDGRKDEITIFQESSPEISWSGEIIGPGDNLVKSVSWVGNADVKYIWDGREENGRLAQDGTYRYRLQSTDRAGNSGASSEITFDLNTEETPVLLSVDFEAFSPNADRVKDTISLLPDLKIAEGIDTYKLSILSRAGAIIRTFEGKGRIPQSFDWEGRTDQGERAPDGLYMGQLYVLYQNGNEETAKSRGFILDTVYPTVEIQSRYTIFSPNQDGLKDRFIVQQETSEETLWEGTVLDASGKIIRQVFWKGRAESFTWDGTDQDGNTVSDGNYRYRITTADEAGNRSEASVENIEVDTRITRVFVTSNARQFSPSGDGIDDTITFNTIVNVTDGIEEWSLKFFRGEILEKSYSGEARIPKKVIWDGLNESGVVVEGEYTAEFSVLYAKGDRPVSRTSPFKLDTSAPEVSLQITPTPFSPDNDGVEDELTITIEVEDLSLIESWNLLIEDPKGARFYEYRGEGTPGSELTWDGLSASGELVQAAEDYRYTFSIRDTLGNEKIVSGIIPVDVLVIWDGDQLKIAIASITFAPDKPALEKSDPEILAKNNYVLQRLAEILNKYRTYQIVIEGHANRTQADPTLAVKEQKEELLPLSRDRAQTVKDALIALGVAEQRLSVVGRGSEDPKVSFEDRENWWKNRRVEFILVK